MAEKYVAMKHSLAKELMKSGMIEHHSIGGFISGILGGQNDYQASLAPTQTSNYGSTIDTAGSNALAGYGTSQDIQKQQQGLAQQLLAQSQGTGPNPAQAALNASTGQNISGQAALAAGVRGASANPGQIARLAAEQGATTQQQAIGQGATLQAQQQIAAQQQLAAQQAAMAAENAQEQSINSGLYGTAGGLQNSQNNTSVANYGQEQGINSGVASANASAAGKAGAGFLGGLSSQLASFSGGMGGSGGGSAVGSSSAGISPMGIDVGSLAPKSAAALGIPGMMFKGGQVPDHLHKMASIYHPHMAANPINFKAGGTVPGKATVPGDSIKNDTVLSMVSPGEEVLPRSVTQAPNAPEKAAEFVKHLQEKKDGKKGDSPSKTKETPKQASLEERVKKLEKLLQGRKK